MSDLISPEKTWKQKEHYIPFDVPCINRSWNFLAFHDNSPRWGMEKIMNSKLTVLSAILSCVALTIAAEETKYFSVSKSPLVRMNDNKVEGIISRANNILSDKNKADERCHALSFEKDGSIKSVSRKNSVDTRSELQALLTDTSTNVHVVARINYCGGPATAGVVGCAGRGTTIVVEDVPFVSLAAVVWLHEYGHTQNLSRSTEGSAHAARGRALMNATVSSRSTLLDQGECKRLTASSRNFDTTKESAAAVIEADFEDIPEPESELEEILFTLWVEGPPVAELKTINAKNSIAAELRQILLNIEKRHLWANAVTALGLHGDQSDIPFLRSFFLRGYGDDFADDQFIDEARLQVPFSIGYLSARFETSEGFVFLRDATNPRNNVEVFSGSVELQEFLANEVAKSSLIGMALASSSSDAAIAAIDDAEQANRAGLFDLGVDEEFFEGLAAIREGVSERGLEAYIAGDSLP